MLSVNLHAPPQTVAEAFWFANLLQRIEPGELAGDIIQGAGRRIGAWTLGKLPAPGFPWFAVGMRNHHLAAAAAELLAGRLYSPGERRAWNLAIGLTTLDQLVEIGPTHDLIGHPAGGDGRGVFRFDPIGDAFDCIHPALWAADAETQTSLLVQPTHCGEPVVDGDAPIRQMLAQRSDLFISRNLRFTSQALAAAQTAQPAMGGRAWTALIHADEGVKAALSIWCNSTLGLLLRSCYAQTTQAGRATMQVNALGGFPVPDLSADGPAATTARSKAASLHSELAELPLEPCSYAFQDANRARIDAAVLDLIGLGESEEAARAVAELRGMWCREPAVHGGNKAILRALGSDSAPG